jgi:hypothetical protein
VKETPVLPVGCCLHSDNTGLAILTFVDDVLQLKHGPPVSFLHIAELLSTELKSSWHRHNTGV